MTSTELDKKMGQLMHARELYHLNGQIDNEILALVKMEQALNEYREACREQLIKRISA